MKQKIIVIHHSADYDGIFCREIARKFLPDAELIGWDFSDKPLEIPECDILYVMDLPLDRPFGFVWDKEHHSHRYFKSDVIWIDHHKSSIESHPTDIPGYRIDGVAACRLAWQWFVRERDGGKDSFGVPYNLPQKEHYIERVVGEPLAVRLAGEYDIWDKRDPRSEVFQFGLRSQDLNTEAWKALLGDNPLAEDFAQQLLEQGTILQRYQQQTDASVVNHRSFLVEFDGLKFLALNTARCNSLTFAALDKPETGHDALLGFYWKDGWNISMYHANHRKDLDLSTTAKSHGGGGHRGACGFRTSVLPFQLKPISP